MRVRSDRAQYQYSTKGRIIEGPFVQWFENLFIVEKAAMLRGFRLMDDLSAHISIKVIE